MSPAVAALYRDPDAERVQAAVEWIAPHCDIEERLRQIPPSAQVRGVWSRILDRALEKRGLLEEYQARRGSGR